MKNNRRHKNWNIVTGTKLTFPEFVTSSGICANCVRDGVCEIGKKAREGRALFPEPFGNQFGAEKRLPNLEDIQILSEIFGKEVIFRNVETKTKLGGFDVSLPIVVAAMGSTKVAYNSASDVAAGAAVAGIPYIIGENVFPTYGEKGLKKVINSYLENFNKLGGFVVQGNVEDRKVGTLEKGVEFGAHAIEIKLGQGAKMGLGGEIRFKGKEQVQKYKKIGYTIIEREDRTFERHSSPGSIIKEKLKSELIRYSNFNVPIWIKIAVGRNIVEFLEWINEVKKKENIKIEAVTVDGFGGGTGMSPWLIMNETSLPSASILHKIKNKLNYDLIVAGGYSDGIDIAKALMLGADGVGAGRPFVIAANIPNVKGAKGVSNYVSALKEELQMVCACLRKNRLSEINGMKENLVALSSESEKMFGL